jgi:hypothetical protein
MVFLVQFARDMLVALPMRMLMGRENIRSLLAPNVGEWLQWDGLMLTPKMLLASMSLMQSILVIACIVTLVLSVALHKRLIQAVDA